MADETPSPALDRIDRAIARIEATFAQRTRAAESAVQRHAVLRARMADAVRALDDILARGTSD